MKYVNLAHIKFSQVKQDLKKNIEGASMIEYSILIGIITAGVVATVVTMGGKVGGWWTTLDTNTTP